jgi:hypothetical protein
VDFSKVKHTSKGSKNTSKDLEHVDFSKVKHTSKGSKNTSKDLEHVDFSKVKHTSKDLEQERDLSNGLARMRSIRASFTTVIIHVKRLKEHTLMKKSKNLA